MFRKEQGMAIDKRGRKLPKGIRQRGNTFEGRYTHRGESYTVHGNTVSETQDKLDDLKYQLKHGIYIARKDIYLTEWIEEWLEDYVKAHKKIGTYTTYKDLYHSAIRPEIALLRLQDITVDTVEQIYKRIKKKREYSKASMETIAVIIKGSLLRAERKQLINSNPAKAAELPIIANCNEEDKKQRIALTREQQELFMECAKGSYLYNLFYVLLRTGMRVGEALALKYTDIDKKNNQLHISRTLKYVEGKFVEDTPKSKTSIRDIPLTDNLIKVLDAQRNYWGFKIDRIDRYLFCDDEGKPLYRGRVQTQINRAIRKAREIDKTFPDFTPHTFRHTFATRAIEEGMETQVLKTILGHGSYAMTMDLYAHVLPDKKQEAMKLIENAF